MVSVARRHLQDGLTPRFRDALNAPDPLARLIAEIAPGVFTFDVFSKRFCAKLVSMLADCESVVPNSMNKYGIELRQVGMGGLCKALLDDVVNPLTRRFYPSIVRLCDYHGFVVAYAPDKQRKLMLHCDQSDVTLNICLGKKFTGGDLILADNVTGRTSAALGQVVGRGVLHRGSQLHRTAPVTSGERMNLILWCRTVKPL